MKNNRRPGTEPTDGTVRSSTAGVKAMKMVAPKNCQRTLPYHVCARREYLKNNVGVGTLNKPSLHEEKKVLDGITHETPPLFLVI